jgi:predicted DNA-binding antitoxin AbrB/MazE fold protein
MQLEVESMTTAIKAVYEHGVFKPKEPVTLEEHTEVDVLIETTDQAAASGEVVEDFVGFIKDAPEGVPLAAEHDLYLYGELRR